MALVVEDGTGLTNSTSYASLADIRAFATARGVTLSTDDTVLEPLVIKAMDYIEAFRDRFKGDKANATQALQFPRSDVYIDGVAVEADAIPVDLTNALAQLVMVAVDTDLAPTGDGQVVVKEKIGPIETQYDTGGSDAPQPVIPSVSRWLEPLLGDVAGGGLILSRV